MKLRPNIIRLTNGIHRLDLRGKAFRGILQTVSGGKKSLEFSVKAAAERKADEIAGLLQRFGSQKMETLEAAYGIDPVDLANRLRPFGVTVQEAVDFFIKTKSEELQKNSTQTFGILIDAWIAEKKKEVEQKTLRADTYETLFYKVRGYKAKWAVNDNYNSPLATPVIPHSA